MLPKVTKGFYRELPKNKKDPKYKDLVNEYMSYGIKREEIEGNIFLLQDERENLLKEMGINKKSSFYEYCLYIFDYPNEVKGEELFGFVEINENYKEKNWINIFPERGTLNEKYPNASKRYLQISSIEGGGSYFYDKETDYVYDVNWGEEEVMITGELKPWFTSFYDFLEWIYSEEDNEVIADDKNESDNKKPSLTLSQLSSIIPWAGLENIEAYSKILNPLFQQKDYKDYKYLFNDLEKSVNEDLLNSIELPILLVNDILDSLGMVAFYDKNINSLDSLTYDENGEIIHHKDWTQMIREEGWEKVLSYSNENITILKASYVLQKYGYDILEKLYERTHIDL